MKMAIREEKTMLRRIMREAYIEAGIDKFVPKETLKEFMMIATSKYEDEVQHEMEMSPKEYEQIFEFWNKQEALIAHRNLTDKIKRKINSALKEYRFNEINTAIRNYSQIIAHPETYWFSYKWTLTDFLQRGIEKFLDWETVDNNFKRKKVDGSSNQPKTGKYTDL